MVCSHADGFKIVHLCWCLVLELELFLIGIWVSGFCIYGCVNTGN